MKLKVRMEGEQKDEALPHRPRCAESAAFLLRKLRLLEVKCSTSMVVEVMEAV